MDTAIQEVKNYSDLELKPKILLVEDDIICQFVQKRILESYGYQVDIAGTGAQALLMFGDHYVGVVLDVDLPDMKGFQVSKTIRERETHKHTPIIGVTSHGDEIRAECLAAGYDEVTSKPANTVKLGNILQQFLPNGRL